MPTPPRPSQPGVDRGIADGVRALRLLVLVALVVDAATAFYDFRLVDTGWRVAVVTTGQLGLATAAAAAVMWWRPRLAVVLCSLVAVLSLTVRFTSSELWLLPVVAVTVTARAAARVVVAVAVVQIGYVVLFALGVERRSPGYGTQGATIAGVLYLVGFGVGLLVRRSQKLLERRRRRLAELEGENVQIRATERLRLADDLQTVVTGGLAAIQRQLDALADHAGDAGRLRRGLTEIDRESRSVLTELRALLEVLRRDPRTAGSDQELDVRGPRSWTDAMTARHVRLAATATFAFLAARAALAALAGGGPLATTTVQLLGWVACAVAVWRTRPAAAVAAAALVVSLAASTPTDWSALPTVVLFFLAARRTGLRRLWVVLAALLGYGALVVVTTPEWGLPLSTAGYSATLAILGGLAAAHFRDAGQDSERLHAGLIGDRDRLQTEERVAVARDLHDVVAHELSLTNLSIMATSASTDPVALSGTLHRIAESVQGADHELQDLLHAMRGSESEPVRTPLVLPSAGAETFARRLTASGFQPVIAIDPGADELDVTTMRTLGRTMQEATTNIVRYAPAGSVCRYALTLVEDEVQLTVVSPMPERERRSALSLGWGLRGIAERVALSRGTFSAGPRRGEWAVDVALPRDRSRVRVGAAQLTG